MESLTPKQAGFYMPAEWHPHKRCWMAWPCHQETWQDIGLTRAREAYTLVAQSIAQYEPVVMLFRPEDEPSVQHLQKHNISLMPCPLNDSWTRDIGPTFLLNKKGQLAGIDWIHNAWGGNYADFRQDNQVAEKIISETKAQYFHAPLVMEGGSFHVDGEGTLLTSKECLLNQNRNPNLSQQQIERYLSDYLNIQHIIWLNQGLIGDETDGHIDEIATFVAPNTILCLITDDKQDANYDRLQENYEVLKSSASAKGKPIKVITIEQPPATYGNHERLTLSYINFYLANKGLVIPSFGYESFDKKAHAVFSSLFPNHNITQINALDVFRGGGGIHCITQQEPISSK